MNRKRASFFLGVGGGMFAATFLAFGCSSGPKSSIMTGSPTASSSGGAGSGLLAPPPPPGGDPSTQPGPVVPPPPVQPLPPTNPPDSPPDVPPGTPGSLCMGTYQGTFTRHGDAASLTISGGTFVLHGNEQDFAGAGTCVDSSPVTATFHFALAADPQYEIQGTISAGAGGATTVDADELKGGRVIDHLRLASGAVMPVGQ